MSRKQAIFVSIVALSCLALFTTPPASAAGRPCPTDHGACFDVDLAGLTFGLFDGPDDDDGDGDVDFLFAVLDGFNDFVTILPDGRARFHIVNHEVPLIYCPDASVPDPDLCVEGVGRASGNGIFGGPFGACPGRFKMSGTGERISDDVVFELTADFQVKASDCDTLHKWFITAEEAN